jgi:hypothetical protein
MKNIRITVLKPTIPEALNITHTGTSYQISRYPDFTNPENILAESLNDEENLLEFRAELEINEDDTVYVRTKYHFSNGKENNWSRVTPLDGDQKGLKLSDAIIATPVVEVSINYNKLSKDELTIVSKPFAMYVGSGSHKSTTWVVKDVDNNIIYKREKDENNLLELKLDKSILKEDKTYIFEVIHHSSTNTDSNIGKRVFTTFNQENKLFKLTRFKEATLDRKLFYRLSLSTTLFSSLDLVFKSLSGDIIKEVNGIQTMTPFVYMDDLDPYRTYNLFARLNMSNGQSTELVHIETFELKQNYLVDYIPSMEYIGKYDYVQQMILYGLNQFVGKELYNGSILLPTNFNRTINMFKVINSKLTLFRSVITLPEDEVIGIPYFNIIPLHNGDIVINYSIENEDNYRTSIFRKYTVNPLTNKFVEVGMVARQFEKYSTSVNKSAVVTRDNNIYYIPAREVDANDTLVNLSMYKLNTENMTVTKENDLPFDAKYNVSMEITHDNKIVIFGGSLNVTKDDDNIDHWTRENNDVYLYDISSKTFDIVGSFPEEIANTIYSFHTQLRKDNKLVLFNNVHNGESLGVHNSILYDLDTNEFSIEDNDHNDNVAFRSTIVLQNGSILRLSSNELDPQNVYKYVANDELDIDIIEPTVSTKAVNDLLVPSNTIVTIESPYVYDTISIGGTGMDDTGTLRWQDDDIVREFHYDDLIITRDTLMSQAEYDAGNWSNVTVLDGVTFIITD